MQKSQETSRSKKLSKPVGKVPKESNNKSVEFLNQLLADEYALFTKTLNYHWNITGPRFHSLHTFLEEHYNDLLKVMDDVAERVRVLGARPFGTVSEMESHNHIELKKDKTKLSADQMLENLLESHLKIQDSIKKMLAQEGSLENDFGTEDFLISVLQSHEMKSWMLRSHLAYN